MKATVYLLLFTLLGSFSCTLMSPSSSSVKYGEDLSPYRPEVAQDSLELAPEDMLTEREPVPPQYHENQQLNAKLASINSNNKTAGTVAGFTIQVYSGTSRDNASKAKAKVYRILPDSRPETKYEQPIYKVRVGEFGDRLEAQVVYADLVQEFPEAIVIPSRIKIN